MNKPIFLLVVNLLVTAMVFMVTDSHAAADLPKLIKQCESCHGPKGNSTRKDVSPIAGIPIPEVQEAMAQFYYFERHCPDKRPKTDKGTGSSTNMCSIASTLSDDEILALARYFNTQ